GGEARADRRDLEQDAARLAEVHRLEVEAVDDRRGVGAALGNAVLPGLFVVLRRRPGDMVDGARSGDTALVGPVVEVEPAALVAANLPAGGAPRVELERLLEEAPALLGVVGVCAHAVEALQRELLRHLGAVGGQRLVVGVARDQRVPKAFRVAEGERPVRVALARDALVGEAALPEVDCLGRVNPPADGVNHPGAGLALPRAWVLEEGDVVSRCALLVAVEEVVDGRVVLVDAFLDEPEPEDTRVKVDVARRVPGDRRDVVDAFELHAASLPATHQPTPAGLQDGSSTPLNRPTRVAEPPLARMVISQGGWPWPRRSKPLAKASRVPSGDQLGCSSSALLRVKRVKPPPSAPTT